ncbi:sugar phosphate isomerase/epimerase family protein [Corynebacterium deserti]|uniref:sugar phosphate isomerase/epimerase family protein n=1 Tax=Corynebacterium deserti TaxID=1408191 RepID=UPI001E3365E7|nr:hypothetical protein [Corynebacterium deserti]
MGKINITAPFEEHLERVRHGVEVAKLSGAKYIRIFSFFNPEGSDPAQYLDEVIARTRVMVELAKQGGITLLHENEKGVYGDSSERVKCLLPTINAPPTAGFKKLPTMSKQDSSLSTRHVQW